MDLSDELDAQILAERARSAPPRRTKERAPTHCKECGTPFRPTGTAAASFPGTLKHAGRGYCSTHLAEHYFQN